MLCIRARRAAASDGYLRKFADAGNDYHQVRLFRRTRSDPCPTAASRLKAQLSPFPRLAGLCFLRNSRRCTGQPFATALVKGPPSRGFSQHGAIFMSIVSQIRSVGRQRDTLDRTPTIESLTSDLRKIEISPIGAHRGRGATHQPARPKRSALFDAGNLAAQPPGQSQTDDRDPRSRARGGLVAASSVERRSVARTKVDGTASILPAGQFKLLSCDLIDLTNQGARLDIGTLADQLRTKFDFSFDSFRTIRRARLAWCHGNIAGIEFISPRQ